MLARKWFSCAHILRLQEASVPELAPQCLPHCARGSCNNSAYKTDTESRCISPEPNLRLAALPRRLYVFLTGHQQQQAAFYKLARTTRRSSRRQHRLPLRRHETLKDYNKG